MSNFLKYPHEYLNLELTLMCGQAFRWRRDFEGWWTAPVHGKVIRIREHDDGFLWETHPEEPDFELLSRYFRLDTDVPSIYEDLGQRDNHLRNLIRRYEGLRLLREYPTEALLSYVCSTANSVPRISRGIEELSRKYGRLIASIGGLDHYSFPEVSVLASADLEELAKLSGLAFRGRNLGLVAQQLLDRGSEWLETLKEGSDYPTAKAELMTIKGVGAKIADCVCLFSLDLDEAVPVDTHVRQIAARYYLTGLSSKTVTPSVYHAVQSAFWNRFGHFAGWAQQFLFLEDLQRGRKRVFEEEAAEMIEENSF